MGGAARPLHDPGNHRSVERGSNLQAARRGGLMKPAKPAGERENTAALTPSLGTRSPNTTIPPLIPVASTPPQRLRDAVANASPGPFSVATYRPPAQIPSRTGFEMLKQD